MERVKGTEEVGGGKGGKEDQCKSLGYFLWGEKGSCQSSTVLCQVCPGGPLHNCFEGGLEGPSDENPKFHL